MIEPLKLTQTRLHRGMAPEERGNCLPTVFACFMHIEDPEQVFQVQEHYEGEWYGPTIDWLAERGWEWGTMSGHRNDGTYYLVSGYSPRGVMHICIYKDGQLWHDPHPSRDGLMDERHFEYFEPLPHAAE